MRMAVWPPLIDDVLRELAGRDENEDSDPVLEARLAAAVEYVQEQRAGEFNFTGSNSALPAPGEQIKLGTVLLAIRWHTRRSSPDGLVDLGELGSARVPSVDPDIERLLGVGRWRAPMVG